MDAEGCLLLQSHDPAGTFQGEDNLNQDEKSRAATPVEFPDSCGYVRKKVFQGNLFLTERD